jgi:hypothetical protein
MLEVIQSLPVVVDDELVVHMNREHEEIVSPGAVVVTGVRLRRGESRGLGPFIKGHVQAPRRLLETVEGLPQKKDLVCWNTASYLQVERGRLFPQGCH